MDHISVSLRIRPPLESYKCYNPSLQIVSQQPPVLLVTERAQPYHFDNIFWATNQSDVYNKAVRPLVDNVKKGYNCTVFAHGQTGTGKTYTMGTEPQSDDSSELGIIPRVLEHIFDEQLQNCEAEINVHISFSEIYNEKVFDLLQKGNKVPLPVSGFIVQGLTMRHVKNAFEAKELLELGNKNRHIGETKQNANSSRSHAIFTVYYNLKNSFGEINAKLHLVDLAGSESVRKTGSQGSTFHEGININKGLLNIGQVISALLNKSKHIPYRQSMITTILQGSLNLDNYISLIACVSVDPNDLTETIQTLEFAKRAKGIKCKPEVQQVIDKFKRENPISSRTPLKRSVFTPMKTPAAKKLALMHFLPINESTQSQISTVDGSGSQFSINSSTTTSIGDINQQALSPVIRKYMTKMEVTLMSHLETVVKNTLRRPTRASLRAQISSDDLDKENTPNANNFGWSNIQNEVSKMVQKEISLQLSVKTVRATSSPIYDRCQLGVRKLNYEDSPQMLNKSPSEALFKVPQLPPGKKKTLQPTAKRSISPIENKPPTPRRRSVRLSLKSSAVPDRDRTIENEVSFGPAWNSQKADAHKSVTQPRRSVRLSLKACNMNQSLFAGFIRSPNQSKGITELFDKTNDCCSSLDLDKTHGNKTGSSSKLRTNFFNISVQDESSDFEQSQKKRKAEKPLKSVVKAVRRDCCGEKASGAVARRAMQCTGTNRDSPYTAHSKRVLQTLNKGSQNDVEKLYSVGPKTAEQILLFRSLKGGFHEIANLAELPGWGPKKFEKFVSLNFLKKT